MPPSIEESAALVKNCVKDHRYWIKNNGEQIRRDDEEGIRTRLGVSDYNVVKVIPNALSRLGLYHGANGVIVVIDGAATGWEAVDRSIAYRWWEVRFAAAVALMQIRPNHPEPFNEFNSLRHEMPVLTGLLCYAIVHDLDDLTNELFRAFSMVLESPNAVRGTYWGSSADGIYELFVYRLLSKLGKITPALPGDLQSVGLGPYDNILAAWDEPDAMVHPLEQICDYHCQNFEQRSSRDPWPPFSASPFDLVPYEILAIYKLREQQGLATPEIDHPLMKLPTASRAPRRVHAIDDPIFAELEALFKKHCQPFWNETLGL